MIPIFLGSNPATPLHFWISHFRPLKGYSPDKAETFLGEKKTERRGENRHVACTVMSIVNRASYCYSGWLCIDLSSAILAGHGY